MRDNKKLDIVSKEKVEGIQQFLKIFLCYKIILN